MKKKIILVLMILLSIGCVFGIAGCKSCKDNGDDPGIVNPNPPIDNEHKHAYLAEVTPPTCTSKGYTTFTCSAGDHSYIDNYVNALGHNYEERVVPFTCTNDGYTRMICTRGDSEYTKEDSQIAAHHVYTPRVVAPTCTAKGYTEYSCKVCNNSSYTEDYVEYIPHVFEDGACTACGGTEGLEYELTDDGAAYSVKGKGTATKTLINVLKVYNGKPVTKVSARAFENDADLLGVNLPGSVTEIGAYALYGLANVTRLILPASIETIGDFAISNCANLEELNLGESLKYLGKNALEYDWKLTTVVLPATLTDIGEYALSRTGLKSVIVGAKLERIGTGAFSDTTLASIDLPLSLENISASAFANCRELKEVKFGGKYEGAVKSIGANAFNGCEKLEIISLPQLESLGTGAFENCSALHTAILCNTLGAIPANAFKNCTSLKSVNAPDGTVSIGAGAFENCVSLGVIELHDNIKEIGDSAFRNCGALRRIYMPRKLTSLGGYAFDGCDGISEFIIPETLTYIPAFAFRNCISLTQITIPTNIEEIKSSAFSGCVKLFEVYNLSALDIVAGATTHGSVAENARNVYAPGGESKLTNEDGFIIYAEDKILLGYTGNAAEVVLPEEIDGSYKVYDYAFYKRSFKSVTVSERVEKIGPYAFAGCTNLTEINFNAAACEGLVGASHVFDNCGKNIILTFGDKVQVVPAYLFYGVDGLGEIKFEEGVCTEIHEGAFGESGLDNGLDYGLKIYLPESLASCHATAFKNCFIGDIYFNSANLRSELFVNSELEANLTIGNKVRVINTGVFSSQNYRTFTLEAGSTLERIENDAFKNSRIYFGIHISDVGEWSGIQFGNLEANPLHVAEVLFLDDKVLTDATINGNVSSFAFYGCGTLETVYIGDNATVAENAFGNCGSLESISLPYLTGSFAAMFGQGGADSLWKVTIRSGEIPAEAFKEFTANDDLEVTLVNVTAIGANAFEDCVSLKGISIQSTHENFEVGANAFSGCESLEEVTLPDKLQIINSRTFAGCTALREIVIPDGVTEIGANAFAGCTLLKKASISADSSLTTIGAGAFENCRNLASIVLPANLSTVASDSFNGCNKLLEVYDLAGCGKVAALAVYTSLDDNRAFESINGYLFYNDGADNFLVGYEGESMELVLPADWNGASYKIYGYAFSYDDRIASVKISDSVTEVGANAFDGCANLVYLRLGAGITDIRNNAFKDCAGLQTVIYGGSQDQWNEVRVEGGGEIFDNIQFER